AIALARLLNPLSERLTAGQVRVLFAELGLQFPPALESVGPFMDAAQSVAVAAQELPDLTVALLDAIEAEDIGEIVSKSVALIDVVRTVITGIDTIATALQN